MQVLKGWETDMNDLMNLLASFKYKLAKVRKAQAQLITEEAALLYGRREALEECIKELKKVIERWDT